MLLDCLRDPDPHVRSWAMGRIVERERISDAAIDAIAESLEDASSPRPQPTLRARFLPASGSRSSSRSSHVTRFGFGPRSAHGIAEASPSAFA